MRCTTCSTIEPIHCHAPVGSGMCASRSNMTKPGKSRTNVQSQPQATSGIYCVTHSLHKTPDHALYPVAKPLFMYPCTADNQAIGLTGQTVANNI
ncbi:hypothetical protein VFPPC_16718 [Pochonia chlamydosporia 170]|uniref:Uncharacterized protein n=1 Tax=Pochonia chlamydosporia 170 TaxID=1380566 RepID=A0A179F6Y8_METCM|nr:hypothetical protein VFPPC_16718 [Pochonia chlamydosporia 170]OAQ61224.1 hypothetical protein VFPPC_16718 [Pochonia chlamydosporia 170]